MEHAVSTLTVCFEDPFWVGVYERESRGGYAVCRIVFGAEPTDREVYDFLLRSWGALQFSPALPSSLPSDRRRSPKRVQREIRRQLHGAAGVGTKAQQALKRQQEQRKAERKDAARQRRQAEQDLRFQQRREKRREKHKGH